MSNRRKRLIVTYLAILPIILLAGFLTLEYIENMFITMLVGIFEVFIIVFTLGRFVDKILDKYNIFVNKKGG